MNSENDPLDSIRNELNKIISQSSKRKPALGEADNMENTNESARLSNKIPLDYLERLEHTETGKRSSYLNSTASQSIDDDIQKMRSELKKSYQLFQSAGEAFDSINFSCLKHRIRDLHLSASQPEMDSVMGEKTVNDSLNKLTDVMGNKFRQHPGEFGDIPELSCFFKACSQLQHGLEALKRHRSEMNDLGKRMNWATNVSRERVEEIQKAINNAKNSE